MFQRRVVLPLVDPAIETATQVAHDEEVEEKHQVRSIEK